MAPVCPSDANSSLYGHYAIGILFQGSGVMAMGKPAWRLWLSLLNAILNVIGFSIAVRWGITAVALACVIRRYLAFPVGQWLVSRLINTPLLAYLETVCSCVDQFIGDDGCNVGFQFAASQLVKSPVVGMRLFNNRSLSVCSADSYFCTRFVPTIA